jgi:transmembrane 9 superfamily protein 2/4
VSYKLLIITISFTVYALLANFHSSTVFALLGLLSPANRGFLATAILLISAVFGVIGGYVSSRVYKAFGGEAWKRNIVMTPLLIPGFIFGVFFLLNLFVWAKGSSGAVPFGTMLALLFIWFVISVPLSVVGSWIGFRQAVRFISFFISSFLFLTSGDTNLLRLT